MLGTTFGTMLLFGSLISATDPVAVIALFKEIKAPKRLTTIIDGESMVNDATAIVLFGIISLLTCAQSGNPQNMQSVASWSAFKMLWIFFTVLAGGALVGIGVGLLGAFACKLDKSGREYQIVLSIIMAYSAFLLADLLKFSGVMASLAAGVTLSLRAEKVIRKENRKQVETFWGFFSFVANSFVFLLMGITQALIFDRNEITSEIFIAIITAIVVLLAARYISVVACNVPYNFFIKKKKPGLVIPHNYSMVLTWGGLRGAIPTALALTIPQDYQHRDLILQMTIACIFFSLFVQGMTVKKLMQKLGIKSEEAGINEKRKQYKKQKKTKK
jgi:CPA1 family monovalent cation:H+ antiporter